MDQTLELWKQSQRELHDAYQDFLIAFDNLQESNAKVAAVMGKTVQVMNAQIALQEVALDAEAAALSKLAEAEHESHVPATS